MHIHRVEVCLYTVEDNLRRKACKYIVISSSDASISGDGRVDLFQLDLELERSVRVFS
jgi:hypothetical protein